MRKSCSEEVGFRTVESRLQGCLNGVEDRVQFLVAIDVSIA